MQVGKNGGSGEYDFLLRGKVSRDFLGKNLPNLLRPCLDIHLTGLQGTIEAPTQSQRMLVLARKRHEIFVAKHAVKDARSAPLASHTCPTADYQTPAVMASGSGQSLRTGRNVSQSVRTLSHS